MLCPEIEIIVLHGRMVGQESKGKQTSCLIRVRIVSLEECGKNWKHEEEYRKGNAYQCYTGYSVFEVL